MRICSRKVSLWMAKHSDAVLIILATIATWLCKPSLLSSFAKVTRNPPPPVPLFDSPPVQDFHNGDIDALVAAFHTHDIFVVMYYAIWDAESLQAKPEFERAASFLQKEIPFAAVNCWVPGSSCATQLKVYRYPQIVVYCRGLDPVNYGGPILHQHIHAFLLNIIRPLRVVRTEESLLSLLMTYDVSVVAKFEFKSGYPAHGYFQYYAASIRSLEKNTDVFGQFRAFAVVTYSSSFLTDNCAFNKSRGMQMCVVRRQPDSFNVTRYRGPPTSRAIVRFVEAHSENLLVTHLKPNSVKSLRLDSAFKMGPAAVLITPPSLSNFGSYSEALFFAAATLYLSCNASSTSHAFATHFLNQTTQSHRARVRWRHACSRWLTSVNEQCDVTNEEWLVPANRNGPSNSCAAAPKRIHSKLQRPVLFNRASRQALAHTLLSDALGRIDLDDIPYLSSHPDPAVADGAARLLNSNCPLFMDRGQDWEGQWVEGRALDFRLLTGLSCDYNRTIRFYQLDSGQYPVLVEQLVGQEHWVGVVLLDWKNEATYYLDHPFSWSTLAEFITKFHTGRLDSKLRSQTDSAATSAPPPAPVPHSSAGTIVTVTTATLESVVMDPDMDVLLLYHAPWCGFCASAVHHFIELAYYFRENPGFRLAGVDVSQNDLPWRFQVERIPTLVFFPRGRKSYTTVFPINSTSLNLSTLVHFVLERATWGDRSGLQAAASLCSPACLANNRWALTDFLSQLHLRLAKLQQLHTAVERRLDGITAYGLDRWWTRGQRRVAAEILPRLVSVWRRTHKRIKQLERKLLSARRLMELTSWAVENGGALSLEDLTHSLWA